MSKLKNVCLVIWKRTKIERKARIERSLSYCEIKIFTKDKLIHQVGLLYSSSKQKRLKSSAFSTSVMANLK